MHLSHVISQRNSRLPPVPGLEGFPAVIRPVARLQGEAGFFAVEEHLEEDFRLAGGAVEDEREVRADAAGGTRGENETLQIRITFSIFATTVLTKPQYFESAKRVWLYRTKLALCLYKDG